MSLRETLADRRADLVAAARRHGASNLRVFGSVARRDERADSDVDLMIDLAPIAAGRINSLSSRNWSG
jgi:predicted nucleotidyltransferase